MTCRECRYYREDAYAFGPFASGRVCSNRDPYQPDLSPFQGDPRMPYLTHAASCCRSWAAETFDQQVARGAEQGRLFA